MIDTGKLRWELNSENKWVSNFDGIKYIIYPKSRRYPSYKLYVFYNGSRNHVTGNKSFSKITRLAEKDLMRKLTDIIHTKLKNKEFGFISTKNMTLENAPEGNVLVKYLEPFFGVFVTRYTIAYFDNPNDYETPSDAKGWTHDNTGNKINVISYYHLDDISNDENPFFGVKQIEIFEKYGTYHPNLGCVGK